ncbi:MAG: MFS transporter [Protaetiibacter sp.]
MTEQSAQPAESAPVTVLDGSYEGAVKVRGPLLRLLVWTLPAYAAVWIIGGAVSGLLLGLQVNDLDPENKVTNLAVVVTSASVVSLVAQPLGGLLSDRTRSRFGRRAPWLVGGATVGGAALVAMGFMHELAGITILWAVSQGAYALSSGPLTAVIPDRVPRRARGSFAAVSGLGAVVAGVAGSFLGSAFRDLIVPGYLTIAAGIVVIMVLFCVFNRDTSSRDLEIAPFRWRDVLRAYWVSPIAHPDFFWAFLGRLLLYLGYALVTSYSLYLLIDYIGLGRDGAAAFAPFMTLAAIPLGLVALLVSGPLSDRLNRRKAFIFAASTFIAVALVVPWVWPTTTGIIVMNVILGIGFGLFQSVDTALITEVLPSSATFAKDLGVLNIASFIPGTIAPGIAALIISLGGYAALFPFGIVFALLGSFAVWFIRSVR